MIRNKLLWSLSKRNSLFQTIDMIRYAHKNMFLAILKVKYTQILNFIIAKVQGVKRKTLKARRIFGIVSNVNMISVTIA